MTRHPSEVANPWNGFPSESGDSLSHRPPPTFSPVPEVDVDPLKFDILKFTTSRGIGDVLCGLTGLGDLLVGIGDRAGGLG